MNQLKNNDNLQRILDAACNTDKSMSVPDLMNCLAELLENQPDKLVAYYHTPTIGNGKSCNMVSITRRPVLFGLSFKYDTIY